MKEKIIVEKQFNGTPVKFERKKNHEIIDCKEGVLIILHSTSGKIYEGCFDGFDDDSKKEFNLKAIEKNVSIAFKTNWIEYFYEQI